MLQKKTVLHKFDSRRKLANLVRHGKSVADLGSGPGATAARVKNMGCEVMAASSAPDSNAARLERFLKPAIVQPNPACPTNRNRCRERIWNRWSNWVSWDCFVSYFCFVILVSAGSPWQALGTCPVSNLPWFCGEWQRWRTLSS